MDYSISPQPRISNRQLKREIARAIAIDKFKCYESKRYDRVTIPFKSGSYVRVKPRARVTSTHSMNYNHAGYIAYSTNSGLWLTRECQKGY